MTKLETKKKFVAFFHFVDWWAIQLGFHIDLKSPNIEIHIPFGFIRIGWESFFINAYYLNPGAFKPFGIYPHD